MALVQGSEYPDDLFYDVTNQIWYEAARRWHGARRLHALGGRS